MGLIEQMIVENRRCHLVSVRSSRFFQVVACAQGMVGRNSFKDTQHSYFTLNDALRLCAAFRGTYLDFKVKFCSI